MFILNTTTAEGIALEAKITELKELEAMAEELKAEIDSLKDSVKAVLVEHDTEELTVGSYLVRFTTVMTQRFDTTAFKKKLPELYGAYVKQTESRRFTIS